MALEVKELKTDFHNDWCVGCGDFGILNAIHMALAGLGKQRHEIAMFSGIGCSGKTPHWINTYGFHTLHGRGLPFAIGAKLANPELTVVCVGGDGDGYGIGAAHFLNSGRRNVDITYIVFDNGVYGLTKGQASPTLHRGEKPKSLPLPNINDNNNPLAVALCSGYTFIARGYSYDVKHLKDLILRGINHKGFALIDVLQPCPTYNNLQTKEWFEGIVEDEETGARVKGNPRVYKLEESGYDPVVKNPANLEEVEHKMSQAFLKTQEWGDRIPIGVLYQIDQPDYGARIAQRMPSYAKVSPAKMPFYDLATGKTTTDITPLLKDFQVV